MKNTQHYYSVEVPKFVPLKELKYMSWQSLMFYHFLRKKRNRLNTEYNYIPYSSSKLQKLYGKRYSKHLKDLETKGWIEINNRYKNAKDGFSKSYRLGDKNFIYAAKHKTYLLPLIQSVYDRFAPASSGNDEFLHDEYLRLVKERHDMLYIPVIPNTREGKLLKTKLERKIDRIHRSSTNRIYSTIINSPKKARLDVVFGDRGRLVNIDVTGMIHQILNRHAKRRKWNNWIEHDLPLQIQIALRLRKNRNTMKKLILKAYSKDDFKYPVPEIRSFLKKTFPEIMEYVHDLNQESTVQAETQKIESQLIREFIMKVRGLHMIPAHDGVFCGERDTYDVGTRLIHFLQTKGLLGKVKMTPYVPRPPTIVDILTNLSPATTPEVPVLGLEPNQSL